MSIIGDQEKFNSTKILDRSRSNDIRRDSIDTHSEEGIVVKKSHRIITIKNTNGMLTYNPETIFSQPRRNLGELDKLNKSNKNNIDEEKGPDGNFKDKCKKAPALCFDEHTSHDLAKIMKMKILGTNLKPIYKDILSFFENFKINDGNDNGETNGKHVKIIAHKIKNQHLLKAKNYKTLHTMASLLTFDAKFNVMFDSKKYESFATENKLNDMSPKSMKDISDVSHSSKSVSPGVKGLNISCLVEENSVDCDELQNERIVTTACNMLKKTGVLPQNTFGENNSSIRGFVKANLTTYKKLLLKEKQLNKRAKSLSRNFAHTENNKKNYIFLTKKNEDFNCNKWKLSPMELQTKMSYGDLESKKEIIKHLMRQIYMKNEKNQDYTELFEKEFFVNYDPEEEKEFMSPTHGRNSSLNSKMKTYRKSDQDLEKPSTRKVISLFKDKVVYDQTTMKNNLQDALDQNGYILSDSSGKTKIQKKSKENNAKKFEMVARQKSCEGKNCFEGPESFKLEACKFYRSFNETLQYGVYKQQLKKNNISLKDFKESEILIKIFDKIEKPWILDPTKLDEACNRIISRVKELRGNDFHKQKEKENTAFKSSIGKLIFAKSKKRTDSYDDDCCDDLPVESIKASVTKQNFKQSSENNIKSKQSKQLNPPTPFKRLTKLNTCVEMESQKNFNFPNSLTNITSPTKKGSTKNLRVNISNKETTKKRAAVKIPYTQKEESNFIRINLLTDFLMIAQVVLLEVEYMSSASDNLLDRNELKNSLEVAKDSEKEIQKKYIKKVESMTGYDNTEYIVENDYREFCCERLDSNMSEIPIKNQATQFMKKYDNKNVSLFSPKKVIEDKEQNYENISRQNPGSKPSSKLVSNFGSNRSNLSKKNQMQSKVQNTALSFLSRYIFMGNQNSAKTSINASKKDIQKNIRKNSENVVKEIYGSNDYTTNNKNSELDEKIQKSKIFNDANYSPDKGNENDAVSKTLLSQKYLYDVDGSHNEIKNLDENYDLFMSKKVEHYTELYNHLAPGCHNKDQWMKSQTVLPSMSEQVGFLKKKGSKRIKLMNQVLLPDFPGQKDTLRSIHSTKNNYQKVQDTEPLSESEEFISPINNNTKPFQKFNKYTLVRDSNYYQQFKNKKDLQIETTNDRLNSDGSTDIAITKNDVFGKSSNNFSKKNEANKKKSSIQKFNKTARSNYFRKEVKSPETNRMYSETNNNISGNEAEIITVTDYNKSKPILSETRKTVGLKGEKTEDNKKSGILKTTKTDFGAKNPKDCGSEDISTDQNFKNQFFTKSRNKIQDRIYTLKNIHSIINERSGGIKNLHFSKKLNKDIKECATGVKYTDTYKSNFCTNMVTKMKSKLKPSIQKSNAKPNSFCSKTKNLSPENENFTSNYFYKTNFEKSDTFHLKTCNGYSERKLSAYYLYNDKNSESSNRLTFR